MTRERTTVEQLRERWRAGAPVVNAWLTLDGVGVASAVASAGFDTVTIDLQHGWASPATLAAMCAAIEAGGAVPFARLAWNEPAGAMRALDLGVRGVIAPMVGSRVEAEALVAATRYPPAGARSYGPVAAAFGAGREQVTGAETGVLVFAMIETAAGSADVDAIASTPGLDGLYVGPTDLSLGLGLGTFADLDDPRMVGALDAVVAAAGAAGIVAGAHAPSASASAALVERGFTFVTPVVDADALASRSAERLEEFRTRLADD